MDRIAAILQAEKDERIPQKQRHTAKRILERLRDEGYTGGYTQVKAAVHELWQTSQEVFMPLRHAAGEAQVDFGYALVKFQGELIKVAFFVMALPYSDAIYVQAYPRECTETFQDGHSQAFAFFEGVPRRISYDNAKTSVAQAKTPPAMVLWFARNWTVSLFFPRVSCWGRGYSTSARRRIGYGGSYFDRFLATYGGPIIALAYDIQIVTHIDNDPHVVPMDFVVTETTFYRRPI